MDAANEGCILHSYFRISSSPRISVAKKKKRKENQTYEPIFPIPKPSLSTYFLVYFLLLSHNVVYISSEKRDVMMLD